MRTVMNGLSFSVMKHFNIHAQDFGMIAASYYVGYASLQSVLGMLVDTVGPIRVLMAGVFCHLVFCYLFTCSAGVEYFGVSYLVVCRFFIGVGSSTALLSLTKLTKTQMDIKKFSRYYSLAFVTSVCGGLVGIYGVASFLENNEWQEVFRYASYAGCLIFCGLFFLRGFDKGVIRKFSWSGVHPKRFVQYIDTQVLSIGWATALISTPIYIMGDTWGVLFLQHSCNLSYKDAAFVGGMFWLGFLLGGLIERLVSQRIGLMETMAVNALLMVGSFLILLFFSEGFHYYVYIVLLVFMGMGASFQITALRSVSLLFSYEKIGAHTAILNAMVMILGFIAVILVGFILSAFGPVMEGLVYSKEAYQCAFAPAIISLFCGVAIVLSMARKYEYSRH